MRLLSGMPDVFLHLDKYLGMMIRHCGVGTYAILFIVIFLETGLVIMTFLPGDSLIFAASTFAALKMLNIYILIITLIIAAVLGDSLNYSIGNNLGKKMLDNNYIKKEYVEKTEEFYNKYGYKMMIFAKFVPIVRSIAPFVAGIENMNFGRFISFNAFGGMLWVLIICLLGYFFGNIRIIREHFDVILLGAMGMFILPLIINLVKKRMSLNKECR